MIKKAMKTYRGLTTALFVLGTVISFCSVMAILYFQRLLDALTLGLQLYTLPAQVLSSVAIPLLLYAVFVLSDCVLNYLYEYPFTKLQSSVYQYFRIAAVEKISRVSYQAYTSFGTGQLIQMVENGAAAGRDMIIKFFILVIGMQLPRILLSILLMGVYNIRVMLIIGIGYVLVFLVTKLLLRKLYSLKNDIVISQEAMSKRFVSCLMELVTFRVNRIYKRELEMLEQNASDITSNTTKIRLIHEAFFAIFYLIVILIKIALIVLSILVSDSITMGMIVAMVSLVDNIYNPIAQFNVAYVDYNLNSVVFKRYEEFLDLPDDRNLSEGRSMTAVRDTIDVEHVCFQYGERVVVDDISFNIHSGQSVAIVGGSGSGKSTLVKIMLGLLKQNQGRVRIDKTDLQDINLNSYYEKVTYISQETPIFDASIRRNIVFDRDVSDTDIQSVLQLVKLDELVASQLQGLDTEVGERGVKLSGGEKQRMALARVYFDQSQIVILDEATSAMDFLTEEHVLKNLYRSLKDKFLVVIAHRLNTVKDVDKILVMKEGRLVQQGSFDQLTEDQDGYFYSLWSKRDAFIDIGEVMRNQEDELNQ